MTKPTRILGVAAIAFVAACGSDSSTGPSATPPADLATTFSEMSIPGLAAVASITGGISPPSTSGAPSGCTYVAASLNFVCPPFTASGLTVTSNYFLLDAAGKSMSQFDAKTIGSLRVKNTITGTLAVSGDNFTVEGQQDQTLSGLQTATHTLNGTMTLKMSGTGSSATIPGAFTMQTTTTITNVVLPAQGSANSYPTSGTVALDQIISATSLSLTSRVVLTFNGTSKVGIKMTVDGKAMPDCTIDLSSNSTPSCGFRSS